MSGLFWLAWGLRTLCSVSDIVANALFVDGDANVSIDGDVSGDNAACLTLVEQRDYVLISEAIGQLLPDAHPPAYPGDILSMWASAQSLLSDKAFPGVPRSFVHYTILVVQALQSSSVELFGSNLRYLAQPAATIIKFAHFYYDSKKDDWDRIDWYRNHPDIIIRSNIPPGRCEYVHFNLVPPEVLSSFDYVWLLDEDIDLKYMNFNFFHFVMSMLKPMVLQPSILLGTDVGKSSILPGIPTQLAKDNHFVVAAENLLSEVMAPVISTKMWPALRVWISRKTAGCDSDVSRFWDIGALLSKKYCKTAGIVIVNAAPVSHMDCRTQADTGKCWHDCGDDMAKPINEEEALQLTQVCPLIPHDWLVRDRCDRLSLNDCANSLRESALADQTWSVLLPSQPAPEAAQPSQPGQPPVALLKRAAVQLAKFPPSGTQPAQPKQPPVGFFPSVAAQPVQLPPAFARKVQPVHPPPTVAEPAQPKQPPVGFSPLAPVQPA
eukprot:TRINITY_DN4402_c0_g1_i1.p1 TRINITY_DN4402_c0_g1~~TRINITY_DN4402_c0_g1_i1.p1  ORF type:complete len:515 (-),score=45.84 TRINITY_DN4402_c0_g1_i1:181-1659(-)